MGGGRGRRGRGGDGGGGGEGSSFPTRRDPQRQVSWESWDHSCSRLPGPASGNDACLSRFMNHRVPAHKRYQPTEYEHAANCATHAVSWLLGGREQETLSGGRGAASSPLERVHWVHWVHWTVVLSVPLFCSVNLPGSLVPTRHLDPVGSLQPVLAHKSAGVPPPHPSPRFQLFPG